MSESERSQSASSDVKSSHHLNHGKESDKKHRGSHESDSDKSSYSEEFYSDDESSRKNQGKKKELIGTETSSILFIKCTFLDLVQRFPTIFFVVPPN